MAVPATPSNLYLQQGNGDVFLSWDLTATATSYKVQRSTDGVTYTLIGSPTAPNYLDSTPVIGTTYYYKVAATNGSGDSAYTAAQTIVATNPGEITLGEVRLRAQQMSEMQNSNFVTLPEWNFFINQARCELYDLLITSYEDYYVAPRLTIPLDGSQFYDLPNGTNYSGAPALYKVFGVDLGLNGSANAWASLKKFPFSARNSYVYPQITTTPLGIFNLRYRTVGNRLMLIPAPASGQYLGLWYFPRPSVLLQDNDTLDGVSGWSQYVIVRAAKYALDKEESDTQKLSEEILYLKQRIEETAMNRDAGQPDTISNVRRDMGGFGNYGGGFDGPTGGY